MSVPDSFKYNQDAKYRTGGVYETTHQFSLVNQTIQVNKKHNFKERFPNIWTSYKLPKITDSKTYDDWLSNQMQFWQNQLNFAVWCSTAGCGVSKYDHLQHKDPMIRSVFRFHVYYQIRRILSELACPLPTEESFSPLNNGINMSAYERICAEFGIDANTNFRQKLDYSNGMGSVRYYTTHINYTHNHMRFTKEKVLEMGGNYDPKQKWTVWYKSSQPGTQIAKIEYIEQYFHKQSDTVDTSSDGKGMSAIGSFVLDYSDGFTQAGVARINDSIRTYAWAILGTQAQAKSSILGTGTAFDAQKQFLADIEDAINSAVDLPDSITRYQNTLQYARSKVDYVVGQGLYMIPSDMDLHIDTFNGYNNLIVIADDNLQLGRNDEVNEEVVKLPEPETEFTHSIVNRQFSPEPELKLEPEIQQDDAVPITHEELRTGLIISGILGGGLLLWYLR
jgi:hypothetical protein